MDKYQTRSISSNFFGVAESPSTLLDNAEADTVQVDFDTVNRGDTTSSVSLTQNPLEPILTNTEDLVETTSDPLEDQGASQGSTEGTQTQQLEPLKSADVILPSSELGVQNMSVADGDVETESVNNLQTFTRVALKSAASSGTYGLKDTTLSGTEDLPNVALNLIDASSNSTAMTISSGSASIGSDVTFSHVTLGSSTAYSYTSGLSLSDVGASLRHVVGLNTLSGQSLQAADIDNDGSVSLSDVGSALRAYVGLSTINTFDLVDASGTRITSLGPSTANTTLYLVENGDVSLDGAFVSTAVNDTPLLSVSGLTSIAENETNAVAATVAGTDTEDGSLSVSLTGSGRDDALFEVVDNQLRIKTAANYEVQDTYRVQLSITDTSSASVIKNIEFNVTDIAEGVSGSIVDGYVAGATIFQDLDNDNVLDAGEPYTVTSSTGEFTLTGIISSPTASLKMILGI